MATDNVQVPPRMTEAISNTTTGAISRAWHYWFDRAVRTGIDAKMPKVSTPTVNDLAVFDADGKVIDPGYGIAKPPITDFSNAEHTHTNAAGGGQLAEGALNLSDVTTNDSSKTKHGFLPKLPDDATLFLDGKGAWVTPTSGYSGSITVSDGGGTTKVLTFTNGVLTQVV